MKKIVIVTKSSPHTILENKFSNLTLQAATLKIKVKSGTITLTMYLFNSDIPDVKNVYDFDEEKPLDISNYTTIKMESVLDSEVEYQLS